MNNELFTADRWTDIPKPIRTGEFRIISNEERIETRKKSLIKKINVNLFSVEQAIEMFEDLLDELEDLENKEEIMQEFLAELEIYAEKV